VYYKGLISKFVI